MLFHDRLKALREDRDLGQEEVAEALHISRTALANYENAIREPSLSLIVKIADYYDVTLDYLLCRTNFMTSFSKSNKLK
ncbi:MAG: helix-turn-helix transcriptional regulator [Bacillota bacterium]|nr:helix-turn-helix transcriptional regulator [Bacillota bacterium]